jgi:hypothetical protein
MQVGVKADSAEMDAKHDSRSDGPAPQLARVVVLEPRKRLRGHFASRISMPTKATFR